MVEKKTVAIAVLCVVIVLCLGLWSNSAQEAQRLEGELCELESDYEKLARVRTSLEDNYSELRTEKEDLEKEYSNLEASITSLEKSYSTLQAESQNIILAIQETNSLLISNYSTLKGDYLTLYSEYNSLKNETREEVVETRIHLINILLPQYGLYTTRLWTDMGVSPSDLAVKSISRHTFIMIYPRSLVPDEYADAILQICVEAREAISDIYGLSSRFPPDRRVLIVALPWNSNVLNVHSNSLMNGKDVIMWRLRSQEELTEYRVNNIGGFIHEVAHLFSVIKGYMGEGVAIYLTVPVGFQVVYNLGDDIWPVEVNATEIFNNLLRNIEELDDPYAKAARVFLEIDRRFGADVIGDALLDIEPVSTWQDLKQALMEITNEPDVIETIFEKYGYSENN